MLTTPFPSHYYYFGSLQLTCTIFKPFKSQKIDSCDSYGIDTFTLKRLQLNHVHLQDLNRTSDTIRQAVAQDRSGSITLEILSKLPPRTGEVPILELVIVTSWYVWWQRRKIVNEELIQTPGRTTLAIRVLVTNYVRAASPKVSEREIIRSRKKKA